MDVRWGWSGRCGRVITRADAGVKSVSFGREGIAEGEVFFFSKVKNGAEDGFDIGGVLMWGCARMWEGVEIIRAFGCLGELAGIWGFPFGRVQRGFAAFPTPRTVSASEHARSLMAAFGRHGWCLCCGCWGGRVLHEAKSSIGRMPEKTARQEKRVQKSGLERRVPKAQ